MELPESTKTGDQLKPTKPKRRLSSILKAPRTPLKCIGADNEDCQEDATKPIEKKRNSRRVSFASTNDIHVFIKDFKSGSPVENVLQDLSAAGEEMLDDKGTHTEDGGQQIIGMETLLSAPLQLSQHHNKENLFNFVVQKDFCDKTVVFSEEDTAFMDMTHSHTICIDDCKSKSAGFDSQRWEDGTLVKSCSTSGKGQIEESELENFLASLSQSSDSVNLSRNPKSAHLTTLFPSILSPAPKVNSKDFFARLHARRSIVDQENQVPDSTRKSVKHDRFSQKQSLCFNEKTVLSIEQENMDLTKSHTATIDNKTLFKGKSLALSEEQDDMEMTRSHTVVMDSKAWHVVNSSGSATRNVSCMSASNKPIIFSEADSDMEMTGAFAGNIEENNRSSYTKRDKMSVRLFPAINVISQAGQPDGLESSISQMDVNVQNRSLCPAASSDPHDMEMTRSQTVVIDSKNCPMNPPSLGKVRRSVSYLSAPNKTIVFSEEDHDMEMTGAFAGNIKGNTRVPTSRDEILARLSTTTTTTAPFSGKLDCKGRKSSQTIGQSGVSMAGPSYSDDMEMTRSQTVVIDSKNCLINPSLGKARSSMSFLSAPNKTVVFSEEDHDMEMTGAFTGNIEENCNHSTKRDETGGCLFPATNIISHFGQTEKMRRSSSRMNDNVQNRLSPPPLSEPDDMEMTRSQTVVIDSKNCPINPSLGKAISSVSYLSAPNKTVVFSEEDHDMEMTGAFTGNIKENICVPTSRDEILARLSTTSKTAPFSGELDSKERKSQIFDQRGVSVAMAYNSDDMEMTRSQTVVIDSKNCPINPSLGKAISSVSYQSAPNKTVVFSEEDHDMEMTGAFTGNIEENRNHSTKRDETGGCLFPATNIISHFGQTEKMRRSSSRMNDNVQNRLCPAPLSEPDDMEMTRSQTVVIDSKNCPINLSLGKAISSVSYLSAPNKTVVFSEEDHDMEMTGAFTGNIKENICVPTSRDQMLARLSTTSKTAPFSGKLDSKGRKSQSGVSVAMAYNSDDMEMTRSQTVVIDSKNCPINPSLGKAISSVSYLSAPNKTVVFSEEDHDMEMTGALTGNIKENTCSPTSRDEMLARLSGAKTVGHGGVCTALSSDPNDMEMTRSQTVVINSKNCGTAKPSLGSVRKSLSCLSGSSKTLMFPTGYSGMQVPKAKHCQTGGSDTVAKWPPITQDLVAYDESEATGRAHSQMAASDPDCMQSRSQTLSGSKSGKPTDFLLSMSGRKLCMSSSSKAQMYPEGDDGIGKTEALTGFIVKNGHPPTNGEETLSTFVTVPSTEMAFSDQANRMEMSVQPAGGDSIWESVPSDDMEIIRDQTVSTYTKNEEIASTRTKCVPHQSASLIISECDQGIEAEENRPATTDGEGKQVCSLSTTNTVSPPDLPNHQAECMNTRPTEGITGPCDQRPLEGVTLPSAELEAVDEMNCDVFLEDCTVAGDEGRSRTANLGDSLVIDPSEIVHDGKGSVKLAKSRRLSLADLQSKLKDIGDMITEQSDLGQVCHTAPVLQLVTASLPEAKETSVEDCLLTVDPGIENPSDCISGAVPSMTLENSKSDRQTNMTEPLNPLRSKSQVARLSLGIFFPKLPKRGKLIDPNQEDPTAPSEFRTLLRKSRACIMQEHGDSSEVGNIHEETLPELNSEEDLSETVEGEFHEENHDQETGLGHDEMFAEPVQNVTQGQKRSCPVDGHEDDVLEERKIRSPAMPSRQLELSKCAVQWDSNVAGIVGENPPSFMTKTLDSTNFSSDSPSQRCEGTFETSAYRSSQYDFQFDEAYEMDLQQKLENGSITMREFLKLFGIDFNIHRPRQSVLPDNYETNHNSEAILLEKHINRPKQRVYEEGCQELTKLVEKLKIRMRDQDNTLKTTNESLWEIMKTYSEEQLQAFGRKLKESKVHFRKQSKAFSHELKIGLYSKLVHTTLVAQQNLTETIEDADELLKHLDECLNDLDAELASMDCSGMEENSATSETELTLQVKQQELETLNMALAENDRRECELELEKGNTRGKVRRLQDETLELEKQITVLDRLIEWRLSEQTEERAGFTFLYDSMGLEVLFEKPASETTAGAAETEQNVADITFQLGLDAETSQCHARLVHNLVGQFIQSETGWVQRYPTRRHIPALLHDVALVVSRCRLLGEEIHRLQKWGSLKLDILEISCVDTQVTILFSSLKATAKFELTLAVTPSYPLAELQLINFKNYIGNTSFEQVEEVISAETPAKNYLTRVVKKIHSVVLC